MRPGRLGYEVWEQTTSWAASQGYEIGYAMQPPPGHNPEVGVYCHSVGTSVHDIGARTSENNQHAFGDRVGYPLARDNWYSVELHVSTPIPEWDQQPVKCTIEESAPLTDDGPQFPTAGTSGSSPAAARCTEVSEARSTVRIPTRRPGGISDWSRAIEQFLADLDARIGRKTEFLAQLTGLASAGQ
jgi:hypothetical protein